MNIKAAIFDLDGVIVDTAKYHFLAWKKLATILNIDFTEEDNEKLKGVSRMASLNIILDIGNCIIDDRKKQEYADQKNKWYLDYIDRMTPEEILPGALEFISELKEAGIKTAIGSASKNTPLIIERLGLSKFFDAVADGNVVKNAKPDPEVFLTASGMLAIQPGNCVVFEDAIAGIESALNAGMICIGVGSEKKLSNAHFVISGLDRLNLKKFRTIIKMIG